MGFEILQFFVMAGIFAVAALLWVRIIYRPGRTLERWEGDRAADQSSLWDETRRPGPPTG